MQKRIIGINVARALAVIGMIIVNLKIEFSVIYALVFSLLCILFAKVWLGFKKAGPLEWVMRKLTD